MAISVPLYHRIKKKKVELVGCAVTSSLQIIQQRISPSSFSIVSAEPEANLLAMQHITQYSLQCGVISINSLSAIQALSSTRNLHHRKCDQRDHIKSTTPPQTKMDSITVAYRVTN